MKATVQGQSFARCFALYHPRSVFRPLGPVDGMGPPLDKPRKMQRRESTDSVLAPYFASDEPASVASNLNTASSLSTSPRLSNTASNESAVDGGFVPEGERYLTDTNAIASFLGLDTTPAPAPAPERRPPDLLQLLAQQPQDHQQAELACYRQMLQQLVWQQQTREMNLLKEYERHLNLLEQTHEEELGAMPNKAADFGAVRQQPMERPHFLHVLQQIHAQTRQERQERQQRKQRLAQLQQSACWSHARKNENIPRPNYLRL